MAKFEGRIVVITGSDSGIGQSMAEEFAREGADIAISFHTDQTSAKKTQALVAGAGRGAIVRQVDVRLEASVAELFEAVDRELGRPDILVNNAGVGAGGAMVAETSTQEFDNVLKTDMYGPFFCCPEFIRRRQDVGRG
ncbi:MAG: SDR family NAD(P)-dependent oxidoreductase, partial [Pseudomonadota bacterium]|nr:SDR family NAD(P)-dependent oxidoreductase [Pseudomonadota bacterium]